MLAAATAQCLEPPPATPPGTWSRMKLSRGRCHATTTTTTTTTTNTTGITTTTTTGTTNIIPPAPSPNQ
ncbi:hypothetical protein GPECTOR_7g1268 [Gonium pectorale]|uniref:Uncharacterized protein n=1 Tax=Gonium pectorale TaxID=33097 RepID=A0A150GUF1_GONPE|nr:hypothetical protein GPECTOR_7g1268 [Gonium pectorale]|eukprot:KXZ53372.1 hypothetical protein GPECTOR_7g1268 [Gonium pectorale]